LRQINACANLIFDGIEFDITYASDSPLASIFYDPSSLTLNRCYIHGSVLGSVLTAPYYGTTTAVRLCDVRSNSNVTVTNCVIDKIQCASIWRVAAAASRSRITACFDGENMPLRAAEHSALCLLRTTSSRTHARI
jgi:hypothetical protein